MTLKHDNLCELEVQTGPDNISFTDHEIEIRFKDSPLWQPLATAETYNWTTGIAGNFELRAKAKVGDCTLYSMPMFATVQFPTQTQILSDAGVTNAMNAEWQQSLIDSTPTQRRERAFFIYLDSSTGLYEVGETEVGSFTAPSNPSSRVAMFFEWEEIQSPTSTGISYIVAHFHTHPPNTYSPTGRPTGPSDTDLDQMDYHKLPGFVYDFSAAFLLAGHSENDPAHIRSFGKTRRERLP